MHLIEDAKKIYVHILSDVSTLSYVRKLKSSVLLVVMRDEEEKKQGKSIYFSCYFLASQLLDDESACLVDVVIYLVSSPNLRS